MQNRKLLWKGTPGRKQAEMLRRGANNPKNASQGRNLDEAIVPINFLLHFTYLRKTTKAIQSKNR